MTRKKVTLAWIDNDKARKTTLKKRRLGLVKKVSELTTLCGTRACLVIYSPGENEPVVWPSHTEVRRQLGEYEKKPEMEKMKKMMNQESYLNDIVSKTEEKLGKLKKRNQEVEMGDLMRRTEVAKETVELEKDELLRLIWLVEEKMKEIRRRMQFLQQAPFQSSSSSSDRLHRAEPNARIDGGVSEPVMWDQWFVDMINNNEPSFADMGMLPRPSFGGTVDMAMPLYGDFRGTTTDMGQPPSGFRPHGGGATNMGLPHGGTVGSRSVFGAFGNGIGMGQQYPSGHIGSSSNVSEQGLAFWPFGGGGGAGNDAGMRFDGKPPPNNFYP
ncbi:hypothetical protein HRI_001636000 [Hibiscus trionum]|uniref:MADS-box domain-containing protein n=1 Tax=Hibiscus trionum TaxID=183268 RepID=A0A9W7LVW5_HIBTR|nr:hypothetical protein HRI_001636000 [Hibiscus trionum]